MKFYRLNLDTATEYESVRASVDAALGYSGSTTCIQPYASAPTDQKGRVVLSVADASPGYSSLVLGMDALVLAGKARWLTADEYDASLEPATGTGGGGGGGSTAWGDLTGVPSTFTPSAHASTHAAAGSDPITISSSQVSGLGTLATQSGTFSGTSSGTNTGDQTIVLSGDVTGSGTGAITATLSGTAVTAGAYGSASSVATFTVDGKGRLTAAGSTSIAIAAGAVSGLATIATSGSGADLTNASVTNAKLANVSTATFKGRATAGTGSPEDITGTQATALLDTFTSTAKGLAPPSGGGTVNYLRADGTWATPPGTGGGGGTTVVSTLDPFLLMGA